MLLARQFVYKKGSCNGAGTSVVCLNEGFIHATCLRVEVVRFTQLVVQVHVLYRYYESPLHEYMCRPRCYTTRVIPIIKTSEFYLH